MSFMKSETTVHVFYFLLVFACLACGRKLLCFTNLCPFDCCRRNRKWPPSTVVYSCWRKIWNAPKSVWPPPRLNWPRRPRPPTKVNGLCLFALLQLVSLYFHSLGLVYFEKLTVRLTASCLRASCCA